MVPQREVRVEEEPARLFKVESGNTIDDLVKALNALGVTPRDLIAILQAIKKAECFAGRVNHRISFLWYFPMADSPVFAFGVGIID